MERLKNPEDNKDVPYSEDVHQVYGELFEISSPSDNIRIQLSGDNSGSEEEWKERKDMVVRPITENEIKSCRNQMKHGSPGCDKITVGELCKVDIKILTMLFNRLLICGNLPSL